MTPPENGATYADDAGRYLLESRIATGGMGEVWRARDTALGRDVAIKLLKPEFAGDPVFRSRFEAEARHAARLQHPGIAAIYDVGEQMTQSGDVRPFLVMELVDGRPLSALIRPGVGMDPDVVRDLLGQAGEALAVAHAAGIVHRDVKPANLLVTADRTVKVTDFGIARALSSASVTGTGAVMGTPQYLSPEQARGEVASPASDVYGLGVVAYECLAGRRPFEKETAVATALAHLNEPVPPLPPSVPADLAAVVMRALAKQPGERFPDAAAFAAAVRGTAGAAEPPTQVAAAAPAADATQVLTGVGAPLAAPPTAATPVARPQDEDERRVNPWLIGLVTALLLAAVLVAWLFLRNGSDDDAPPPAATTPTPTATTPTPTQSPTTSPTAETFDLDESDYVGRDVDAVLADLRAKGLQPRTKEIDNPGDERADSVAAVSPTKGLQEGDRVEVAYYGEPRATQSPTTQQPTTTAPTPTASSSTAPPTPPASTPQTAETTSTTTADASETPAARKDISR